MNAYSFDYDFSKYMDVVKWGPKQITARCPFHNDRRPSFSGNTENGLWRCFACGEKGNWWQLLKRLGVFDDRNSNYKKGKNNGNAFN